MDAKKEDIKKMSEQELKEHVEVLRRDLFKLRLTLANSPLKDPSQISKARKNIARCLTFLRQKDIHS